MYNQNLLVKEMKDNNAANVSSLMKPFDSSQLPASLQKLMTPIVFEKPNPMLSASPEPFVNPPSSTGISRANQMREKMRGFLAQAGAGKDPGIR